MDNLSKAIDSLVGIAKRERQSLMSNKDAAQKLLDKMRYSVYNDICELGQWSETMNTYSASDYCGFSGGGYDFYYGYESAICQSADFNESDRNDETEQWRFQIKRDGVVVWDKTPVDLGLDINQYYDPLMVLLTGVGKWLDERSLEQRP